MSQASDLIADRPYTIDDAPPSNCARWLTMFDVAGMPHIYPDFGPPHDPSRQCWCHPVLDTGRYDDPAVIVHSVAQ